MSNLKWRLALIGVLVLASAWALYPRNVKVRQRRADGTFFDTTTYRVPLRKGLDLSGGMHLALEVDDSKGVVADKAEAIDRALKVVRTRIEGLGVSETVIQKSGRDRILVEIPGIDDRERAIKMVQDQAFLEFQITDKTNGFEKAMPRLDALAKEKGFGGRCGDRLGYSATPTPIRHSVACSRPERIRPRRRQPARQTARRPTARSRTPPSPPPADRSRSSS
jgi:preprotein translocase subunit SecD